MTALSKHTYRVQDEDEIARRAVLIHNSSHNTPPASATTVTSPVNESWVAKLGKTLPGSLKCCGLQTGVHGSNVRQLQNSGEIVQHNE